jgi:sugar phosphate isomerase/epimerase
MVRRWKVRHPLKLGTAQYAYLFNYTLEQSLKEIKAMGFRYVELMTAPSQIWPRSLDKRQRKDLRKQIEQLGLRYDRKLRKEQA